MSSIDISGSLPLIESSLFGWMKALVRLLVLHGLLRGCTRSIVYVSSNSKLELGPAPARVPGQQAYTVALLAVLFILPKPVGGACKNVRWQVQWEVLFSSSWWLHARTSEFGLHSLQSSLQLGKETCNALGIHIAPALTSLRVHTG